MNDRPAPREPRLSQEPTDRDSEATILPSPNDPSAPNDRETAGEPRLAERQETRLVSGALDSIAQEDITQEDSAQKDTAQEDPVKPEPDVSDGPVTGPEARVIFSREVAADAASRDASDRRVIYQALDLYPVERWLEPDLDGSAVRVTPLPPRACEEAHLDTDDWRIHRAGLSLVVRRFGTESMWAILESRDAEQPYFRVESELSARSFTGAVSEVLSHARADDAIGARCRALVGRRPLNVLFRADVRLQPYRLAPTLDADCDGSASPTWLASLLLEETRIPVAGRPHPIVLSQVEVEEQGDAPADLWSGFVEVCGLRSERRSRLDRLLVAAGLAPPPPPELGPTEITPDSTVAEVAFAVLRQFMGRVLDHEPGTRLGQDIEELHQMRVGTRKLRSAIKLYREYLPPRVMSLESELRWLGSVLGPVRDLDVQREVLPQLAEELPPGDRSALDALWESLAADHGRERKKMLRALDSKRFERFKERWIGALLQGPPRTFREGRRPALAVVPELIETMHRKVQKRRSKLTRKSKPEVYHRLRVGLKALRYAVEFHRDLYPKTAKRYAKRVVWWQDCLGDHQDADVGEETLRSYVHERGRRFPPETNFSLGMLAECYRERARRLRAKVWESAPALSGGRWKRFVRTMRKRADGVSEAPRPVRPSKSDGAADRVPGAPSSSSPNEGRNDASLDLAPGGDA